MSKNFFDKISDFVKKIDPKSWPAFFMFVVVLAAAGALNYVGMEPSFGWFIAFSVAAFFGVGVLSWHVVESRTDDSEEQEQIAQVAKWITVGLDAVLLVVNFVRIEESTSRGWDVFAYVIISLAAVVHVAGYLLWTEGNPARKNIRARERALFVIERKGDEAHNVIETTRKKLAAHKYVVDEEAALRQEYAGVDPVIVDDLVAKMKRDYAAKMAELEAKPAETSRPAQSRPPQRQNQMVAYAQDAELAENPTSGQGKS